MKYGWQISEVEDRLSKLPSLEAATDYENSVRAVYQEMTSDYYSKNDNDDSVTKNDFIKAIKSFDFNKVNNKYLNLAIYLGNSLQKLSFEMPTIEVPEYSLERIIDISKTYMRRNERGNNYIFKKVISDPKKIHIKFNQSIHGVWGKSYILNRDEFYILIKSINGVQDTVTFLHESGHIEDYFKTRGNLAINFYELTPMTREHYAFDFMKSFEDEEEVEKVRTVSLYHYLIRIIRLYETTILVLNLTNDKEYFDSVIEHYESFSKSIDIQSITKLLASNFEEELSYVSSFIASLDIYLNCLKEEAPLFVSMYHAGIRDINTKVIDRIIPYLKRKLFFNPKVKST